MNTLTEADVRRIALAALNAGDYVTTWDLYHVKPYIDEDDGSPLGVWDVRAQDVNHRSNIITMDVRPDGTVEDMN